MNKTYYVGQNPAESIVFTVRDERSIIRNLSGYNGVQVIFAGPDGEQITHDGAAVITNTINGVVTFTFGATSIFTVPGDYKVQLKLTNDAGKADYTDISVLKVIKGLESANNVRYH